MQFIELTQIKANPSTSNLTGMESRIIGKISIFADSIISFEESKELFQPQEIESNLPPTKITLSNDMSFFVTEGYDYIKQNLKD